MSQKNRIYVVAGQHAADKVHLVRASSQAQALAHVTHNRFKVRVANTEDMELYGMGQGIKVEDAKPRDPATNGDADGAA